ncbi:MULTISPECIES: peptidoglycan DD-metalloendopeptidase family protein [Acinetobacter]|uniref:LysM peptidoglycan-binding domain-containing protein n=1 Tax=Acinetobacter chengduensis TaxID=2420890 RepID=A0ABX9TX25_9GAMM|nr:MULTISPECIES: peptidoglycan DD-metalloendopeptidase family protein [Acinetobacter]MBI1450605.1 peptidoglycan DD-metalloendopeptidase family protein [Acinetobacter sp. FL51]RKG39930.1 LysM peptidoglycan-binding domain-containing protein [Acinetobacter sp. WCHAc060007]RLL22099.1 LysM peptidoglycan-binding domain-containing protein [Acinetobacter chengduensis]
MSLVFSKAASTAPATIFKTFVLAAAAASALALSGCASKPQVNNSARYVAAPDFYTVRSGDTLSGIAARYGLSYVSVAEMNDIVAPYRIYVGQSLRLKNSSSRRVASTQAVTQVAPIQRQSIALPQNTTTTPSQTTVRTPVAPVTTPSTTATSNTLRWVRPSTGSVLESFNLANNVKGTRYSGNVGDAVVAAADGQVVYAADGLKEYGNLVLVKHINGYITAYAHNSKILVKSGQNVTAGQKIAEMGSSGTNRTMLEFQVRLDGKPINPISILPNN